MTSFPIAILGSSTAIFALLCIAAALLVIRRTRSTHVVTFRLWRLIHGNAPVDDLRTREFVEEQSSLMAFRFLTGMRVSSLQRAHRIIYEIESSDIDVSDLRLAGDRVDSSALPLRILSTPARWELTVAFALIAAICIVGSLAGLGAFYDSAILKFKNGGPTFVMDTVEAKIVGSDTSIWRSDCKNTKRLYSSGFSAQQFDEICRSWQTNEYIVPRTVAKQRTAFFILALGCFFLAQYPLRFISSGYASIRLKAAFRSKEDSALRS